jgi:hypothetical protein
MLHTQLYISSICNINSNNVTAAFVIAVVVDVAVVNYSNTYALLQA